LQLRANSLVSLRRATIGVETGPKVTEKTPREKNAASINSSLLFFRDFSVTSASAKNAMMYEGPELASFRIFKVPIFMSSASPQHASASGMLASSPQERVRARL